MEEKILKQIVSSLEAINAKLEIGPVSGIGLRGPVADPGPRWVPGHILEQFPTAFHFRGPVADPAPWQLLDKAKLAQIKVRNIDGVIMEMEKQIDSLKLERDLLKQEYKIK
ncbi:MAG: hypothetical protein OEW48_09255 [Phycisphaerae bacterium]|nr:hypothetical protein [Phycisphaerae bacterium]